MDLTVYFTAPKANLLFEAFGALLFFVVYEMLRILTTRLFKYFSAQFNLLAVLAGLGLLFFFSTALPALLFALLLLLEALWLKRRKSGEEELVRFNVLFSTALLFLIFAFWPLDKRLILSGLLLLLIAILSREFFEPLLKFVTPFKKQFTIVNDAKSQAALIAIFISSLTLGFLMLKYWFKIDLPLYLAAIAFALVVLFLFLIVPKGKMALFLPLAGGVLTALFVDFSVEQFSQFLIGEVLALLVAVLSLRLRFLSSSGSVMLFLLATVIFGLGGWAWSVPILVFFVLSSILSKFGKDKKRRFKDTFEKSDVRDHAQVLANGGIGGLLVLLNAFFPLPIWYWLYILSLMVATSDTWSTEIGVLFSGSPRLITTFKKVEPGISGGISLWGTLGGIAGSFLILLSAFFFVRISFSLAWQLLLISLIGNLLDSLFGATLQGQYRCAVCGKYTEKKNHCNSQTILLSGIRTIGNDFVNVASNLSALGIFLIVHHFGLV